MNLRSLSQKHLEEFKDKQRWHIPAIPYLVGRNKTVSGLRLACATDLTQGQQGLHGEIRSHKTVKQNTCYLKKYKLEMRVQDCNLSTWEAKAEYTWMDKHTKETQSVDFIFY